jgi:aminoglycoside phosphotransferase (APT) family kinase protein
LSRPIWAADVEIGMALATRLIAAQFPALAGQSVEQLGTGWDNEAYVVAGRYVFRFPRRTIAVKLIEREAELLPSIAPHLPLPVPVPEFLGTPGEGYPWPFAGYAMLPGRTACSVALTLEQRFALAEPLAHFLRELHGIAPAPLVERGLPPDEIARLDPVKRLPVARDRLAVVAAGGFTGFEPLVDWMAEHPAVAPRADELRVLHGDLYARHLLLGDDAGAAGVIDWGDMHLGDPALDVAIAFLMLPQAAHARFRAAYGPIDERTWDAARYRAIYHSILELDYGIAEDDRAIRDSGAQALQFIREALT